MEIFVGRGRTFSALASFSLQQLHHLELNPNTSVWFKFVSDTEMTVDNEELGQSSWVFC